MALTDEWIDSLYINGTKHWIGKREIARAIESAACAERDARIAELLANEKVLLAQIQGHTEWREKIVKASEQAYGESAVRYKFSLTKAGKCMNTFPKEIDGRWFALVPADDDGHIGHIARIAELERQLEDARKDARRLDWMIFHTAQVQHTRDGEYCRVLFYDDGTSDLTAPFGAARDAIDNAMKEQT